MTLLKLHALWLFSSAYLFMTGFLRKLKEWQLTLPIESIFCVSHQQMMTITSASQVKTLLFEWNMWQWDTNDMWTGFSDSFQVKVSRTKQFRMHSLWDKPFNTFFFFPVQWCTYMSFIHRESYSKKRLLEISFQNVSENMLKSDVKKMC